MTTYTKLRNLPLLVWVDDPALTHEETLTRAAAYVLKLGEEMCANVKRLLTEEYDYAYTADGTIFASGLLVHRINELTGE